MAKRQQKSGEDPMVAAAFDVSKHEELARVVADLSPEAAAFYVIKLEAALKKRKLQLTGYLLALVVWLVGMVVALAYFGVSEGFTGWVFLVPFGLVGLILYSFGRWAEIVGKAGGDVPEGKPLAKAEAKRKPEL